MVIPTDVVIMAAGKGMRRRSMLPKVLQRLGRRDVVAHVMECAAGVAACQGVGRKVMG